MKRRCAGGARVLAMVIFSAAVGRAQELEPRAFSPHRSARRSYQARLQHGHQHTARIGFRHVQRDLAARDVLISGVRLRPCRRTELTAVTRVSTEIVDEASLRYAGWRVTAPPASACVFRLTAIRDLAVLLKLLSEEFAWSREAVSSAFASTPPLLTAPLMGSLFDRLGPQRISGPCLLVSGCAFASLALTPRLWHLRRRVHRGRPRHHRDVGRCA